ncbi:DUF2058 domain-containing protein [Wenzhouxiangella sp. XN201]|uniref:DUF2058 domain-containing protein n=1 Tax=Wenzhouxiangella sp. XN201 TaxID=2710755 RepID=UPI0013CADA03|nr:DUF2058 family protein [Wenzhouxiangella sp. XN201]NEZ05084.1 DUF2058 domain-containing protein [Wenzhouxiangella sp. XN201]
MGTLQDALLKAGLADEKQAEKPRRRGKPGAGDSGSKKARANGAAGHKKRPARKKTGADSDLARAYAARRKAEANEKEAEKQRRVAEQEERRRRNLQLDEIIKGNTLNRKDAEIPRYFEHMGRIRRVLCTPEQREQLNRGEIGVVNLRGSYLLVSLETLEQYRELAPDLVPGLEGREEPEDDGSHYPPVPDDLVW